MPLRAHKSWQYPQPVRRYDHFCRSWAVKTMRWCEKNHKMEIDRWTIVSSWLFPKKHPTHIENMSVQFITQWQRDTIYSSDPRPKICPFYSFFHEMPLRWINNTIGLHNHREFVIMVGTLLLIAFLGMGIDLVLLSFFLATIASQSFAPHDIFSMVLVALHLGYSFALLRLGGPILRIHVGLISRNELAQEPDCRKLTVKSFFWYSTH